MRAPDGVGAVEQAAPRLRGGVHASGLLTDLYQLTMLDVYLAHDMCDTAVFEFFVRRLPENRSFLLAAGLEQLLAFLENIAFSTEEIGWLESTGRFSPGLLEYLSTFRFRGEVRAMPEGSVFFGNEPVVQVIASLPEAQLIETRLINLVQFQTMIASKAARCVLAAPGKMLVDFGLRRAHGEEAGLLAARAAYLAGFTGTSTVLAQASFGIPIFGTMAHSYVEAHASETEAFENFARAYPDNAVLLIDTYDTLAGAEVVTRLARKLRQEDISIRSVRLDSGDLPVLAAGVRDILDRNGCKDIGIFCSGGIDEYALAERLNAAPVDGFGIGTALDVSADAPYLDCAYKLQEYAGTARRKRSSGKATWPGRKQVYRRCDSNGRIAGDVLAPAGETHDGQAMLMPVMRDGRRLHPPPMLIELRDRAAAGLASLPDAMRNPLVTAGYDVEISASLKALAADLDQTAH